MTGIACRSEHPPQLHDQGMTDAAMHARDDGLPRMRHILHLPCTSHAAMLPCTTLVPPLHLPCSHTPVQMLPCTHLWSPAQTSHLPCSHALMHLACISQAGTARHALDDGHSCMCHFLHLLDQAQYRLHRTKHPPQQVDAAGRIQPVL